MAIQLIVETQKDRLILESVFRNLGADAVFSRDLNDALSIFEKARPRAVFIVDGGDPPAEIQLRELLRAAPLIPIVVLLKNRDSSRAIAYMKLGAFDCAQSPWTEEELRPVYKKALNISGTALRLDTEEFRKRNAALTAAMLAMTLIFGFISGCLYGFSRYKVKAAPPSMTELPYSHPSGLAFDKDGVLVSDWYTQAIYRHNTADFKISGIAAFPDTVPVGLADGPGSVWLSAAGGGIERRLKNGKFTVAARAGLGSSPPAGACYDGLYFWTADSETKRISRRMANDELTETASFAYPGPALAALACDSRFLWAADEKLRALVKLSPHDPETVISKTELPQYASKTLKITAMGAKDGKLWFAAEDKGKGWLFNVAEPR